MSDKHTIRSLLAVLALWNMLGCLSSPSPSKRSDDAGAEYDAALIAYDDSGVPIIFDAGPLPDAEPPPPSPPGGCTSDGDCETTPCYPTATCNTDTGECTFVPKNCSLASLASDCSEGACEPMTGECYAKAINANQYCDTGVTCVPGNCSSDSQCSLSGTYTEVCQSKICSGTQCVTSLPYNGTEKIPCTVDYDANPVCCPDGCCSMGQCVRSTSCDSLGCTGKN